MRSPAEPRVPVRSFATWALGYGMAGRLFARAARRGDLVSRLESDRPTQLDPYAAFDDLRARGPVVPGPVAYASASHAAVTEILRSDVFGTGGGHGELPGPVRRVFGSLHDPWAASVVDPPSMLATDAPEHTRYRRLVSRAFTARAITSLEDDIRDVAERLLDDLEAEVGRGRRAFDLVDRYAAQLPVAVIARMLGVPDSMHARLLEWGNGAALTLDPALTWRAYRGAERDMRHLHRWFDDHIRTLRAAPGDDLLSRLAVSQDAARLSDVELRATGLLVLGAGFETTVSLISNAVHLLATHPEQRAILDDDPSLWARAVDEVLRFDSPVQATLRIPHRDAVVGEVRVPAGTPVLAYLAGANRDPAVFVDPHLFDVRRDNAADHVAFSSGAHYCLGAALARREGEVALRALYERFPDLDLDRSPSAGVAERRPTRVLRGWETLPVVVGAGVPVG